MSETADSPVVKCSGILCINNRLWEWIQANSTGVAAFLNQASIPGFEGGSKPIQLHQYLALRVDPSQFNWCDRFPEASINTLLYGWIQANSTGVTASLNQASIPGFEGGSKPIQPHQYLALRVDPSHFNWCGHSWYHVSIP
ncbi:hypothetical protein CHS0354_016906, partial [Potamilus streckersoni]